MFGDGAPVGFIKVVIDQCLTGGLAVDRELLHVPGAGGAV